MARGLRREYHGRAPTIRGISAARQCCSGGAKAISHNARIRRGDVARELNQRCCLDRLSVKLEITLPSNIIIPRGAVEAISVLFQ